MIFFKTYHLNQVFKKFDVSYHVSYTIPVKTMNNGKTQVLKESHFGKTDFELGVGGEGQDMSRYFEGSFGPYVQYCPCEALEQKLGQKPKPVLKGIELSYCHYSICLLKTSILEKNNFKIG